jgi:Zn finger protein HypA/HybF involved in hydrogenase expression
MKQIIEAVQTETGIVPKHEIEIVCANCEDPVSEAEETSGTCTACGSPWATKQNLRIYATSVPAAGAKAMGG